MSIPVTFEEYAAARGPSLLRFAYLTCRDRQLAEDLVQEALTKAYPHWGRVQRADNPEAYLRRIVLNQLLSWRRRRWWTQESSTAEPPESPGPQRDVGDDHGDRDAVWRMLGTLPPRQRAALVLRYYEDLDDATIASVLGCSPATVRAHVSKASARLRETYDAATLTPGGQS